VSELPINQIICGDCIQVLNTLPDNSIDLIVTDPPYGINLTPQRQTSAFKDIKIAGDTNNNLLTMLPTIVDAFYRIAKNVVYVFCNWQSWDKFYCAFEQRFKILNCLVWNKQQFGLGWNFRPIHEFILLATKTTFTTKSHNRSNVLEFQRIAPQQLLHVAQKPVELLELLIEESTNEGDLVLDPFVGSGTTAVACRLLNRDYIGIEISEEYCKIAEARLKNIPQRLETFGGATA